MSWNAARRLSRTVVKSWGQLWVGLRESGVGGHVGLVVGDLDHAAERVGGSPGDEVVVGLAPAASDGVDGPDDLGWDAVLEEVGQGRRCVLDDVVEPPGHLGMLTVLSQALGDGRQVVVDVVAPLLVALVGVGRPSELTDGFDAGHSWIISPTGAVSRARGRGARRP